MPVDIPVWVQHVIMALIYLAIWLWHRYYEHRN